MHNRWYHLSHTWLQNDVHVIPRVGRVDDENDPRDQIPFIAVCPTILQCVVAIGEWRDEDFLRIYVTDGNPKRIPKPADHVFDFAITQEHRFHSAQWLSYAGVVNVKELKKVIPHRETSGMSDKKILQALWADVRDLRDILDDYVELV